MKKIFISLLLCSSLFYVNAVAENVGPGSDIEDWGVVVDGKLSVKVSVDNPAAVTLTPAGEQTPVSLQEGVNTVKVSDTDRNFTVKANDGYAIESVKVGDKSISVVDGAANVPCEAGKEVVIVTKKDTSSTITLVANDDNITVRYFDLRGIEVSNPQKGQIYVMLKNGKAVKIRK